jgi:prevent-host-death family protein
MSTKSAKSVGAYEAKTTLGKLLSQVEKGRTITITRHSHDIARLVPVGETKIDKSVFERLRALRKRLILPKGETVRDLLNEGRRI